jgi:hypothetical protein
MSSGPAVHFVGLVISRDRRNKIFFLSAPQYIDHCRISKFNMTSCHPVAIPVDKEGPRFSKTMSSALNQEERDALACIPYRDAVGSIMYAAIRIRFTLNEWFLRLQ